MKIDRHKMGYILGVLRAAEFLAVRYDQPTMAACIVSAELIEGKMCSLTRAKAIAREEGVNLAKVWKELPRPKFIAHEYFVVEPMDCHRHIAICGACGKDVWGWSEYQLRENWHKHRCAVKAKPEGEG